MGKPCINNITLYKMKKTAILFLFTLFSCCLFAQIDVVTKGNKMPQFKLTSEVNGNIDSKKLKGKVVLINIFATWCGPCQKELAEVQSTLWPRFKDDKNFVMLTVGREHTDEELTKYNGRKKFTFPLYPDPTREFTSKFALQDIPRSYLIDQNGKIVYASKGFKKESFEEMMTLISELLETKKK